MGCNNCLTDGQLEAMFLLLTATNQEIQQIEQPMECLIERLKHKSKRCTRFFSNEAAFKQHGCEPPIKKKKWPHCGKTINYANNLEKHLRNCEKAPTHPAKQQLHQTALNGPTSSENGPSTPKKLIVEGMQVVGAPAEHIEHWKAPEIVESALKYMALTLRKTFNSNNKRDVLQRLEEVVHSMTPMTEGQSQGNVEAAKWCSSLNMNFCKPWRQDRSGCYVWFRGVQVNRHPQIRWPISCRI